MQVWHVVEVAVYPGAAVVVGRRRSMLVLGWLIRRRGIKLLVIASLIHVERFLCLCSIRDLIFAACKRAWQTRWKHCSLLVSLDCTHAGGHHAVCTLATAASCRLNLLLRLAVVALVLLMLIKGSFWPVRFSASADKPSIYLVCRPADSFLWLAAVGGYLEAATDSAVLVGVGAAFTTTIISQIL